VRTLDRLIARYPAHPQYLKAHLLLGRSLLALGDAERALEPLRYYVQGTGIDEESVRARIDLGYANLALGKYHEALLLALEIQNIRKKMPSEIRARNLILKSRALIGLNEDFRAKRSLDSANKLLQLPEAEYVGLELQLRSCERLPSKGPLDESQIRTQLDRRGTCLLEGLNLFRKTLDAKDAQWSAKAHARVEAAFARYTDACANPVQAVPTGKQKRTAKQLLSYREELAAILRQDCRAQCAAALELIKGWKPQADRISKDLLEQFTKKLEKLASAK
jgi:hypothetical protein